MSALKDMFKSQMQNVVLLQRKEALMVNLIFLFLFNIYNQSSIVVDLDLKQIFRQYHKVKIMSTSSFISTLYFESSLSAVPSSSARYFAA